MRRERRMQIDKLFHSVLRREPSDRAEFLVRACKSDISLRVAVEALLLPADDKAHNFLEHSPEPFATVLAPGRNQSPSLAVVNAGKPKAGVGRSISARRWAGSDADVLAQATHSAQRLCRRASRAAEWRCFGPRAPN